MYDNGGSDSDGPPPLPDKSTLRRRRTSRYTPLFDDLQKESERGEMPSNGEMLQDEISKLMKQLASMKSESTPYPPKEKPITYSKNHPREQNQAFSKSFGMEESFVESINKLSRPKISKSDLPTFDGTGSKSFKLFLREFEDITRMGSWSDEEKLAALPTVLDKRPKMLFHRLDPAKKADYDSAIAAIAAVFDAPEDICILRRELHNIQQGNQPLFQYLERLEYLFTELSVAEDLHLEFLTAGLRSDLQDFLYLKQLKSYDGAVRALKLKESVKREKPNDARLKAICDQLNALEEKIDRNQARRPPVNNNQADVAALLREINRLKAQNRGGPRGYNQGDAYNRRDVHDCRNCGKRGHTAEICRSPPKGLVGDLHCWTCGGKGHKARQCRQGSANVRCLEETKGEGPLVTVTASGLNIDVLCDSGAQRSVVSETLAKKLGLKVKKTEELARGIGGSYLHIVGFTNLEIKIAGKRFNVKPMVLRDVTHQLLLGIDFLKENGAVMDLVNNRILLQHSTGDLEAKIRTPAITNLQPAIAERAILLPPRASTTWTFLERGITDIQSLPHAPVDVRVMETSEDGVRIMISNRTDDAVAVQSGDMIGEWVPGEAEITDPKNFTDGKREMENLDPDQEIKLKALIASNNDVFADSDETLGHTHLIEFEIDTGDARPIKQSVYNTTPAKRAEIDRQLTELLKQKIIQPSKSPWGAPCLLTKKPGGGWRLCVDYRRLNLVTKKDAYPIPRVQDVLDQLSGAKYFSTGDLQAGFHQVALSKESIPKTGFVTHRGHYEYLRLPFGPSNGPVVFERLLEDIFRAELWDFISIFIDDIIVYSNTFDDHLRHLETMFERLRKAGLKMKRSKCFFCVPTLNFLGHEISAAGIKPKADNIKPLLNAKKPTTTKQVQSFLGLTGYYRRFIKNYAEIARPLYKCIPTYHWGDDQQKSWRTLIAKLTNPPLLEFPNFNKDFILNTDASGFAIGYVLGQSIEGEHPHPVRYGGRILKNAELRYTITEKELLALVYSIRDCNQYLEGRHFKVFTDHQPLTYALRFRDKSGRISRWAVLLQQYSFTIHYKKGTKHKDADAMTRPPIQEAATVSLNSLTLQSMVDIKGDQEKDHQLMRDVSKTRREYAKDEKGVWHHLTKRGDRVIHTLAVPQRHRQDILDSVHKHPTGGHFGVEKTVNKIWQTYYWPGMYQDVVTYIEKCQGCREHKGKPLKASLQSIPCTLPWQDLTVDILGPFKMTLSGNKYILSFVDRFTAWPEAFCIPSCETPVLAQIMVDEIITRHGVPRSILSDNGPNFVSLLMKEVCQILGMEKITTTPYHCQTNGMCERFHRSIARCLAQYTDSHQDDWDKYLPMVLFAYRTSINASRKFTPFLLNYGYEANLPVNTQYENHDADFLNLPTYAIWLKKTLAEFWEQSKRNLEASQLVDHQRNYRGEVPYDEGDTVFIKNKRRIKGKSFKLQRIWLGPYTITKCKHPIYAMVIKGKEQWQHYDRLKRHTNKFNIEDQGREDTPALPPSNQPEITLIPEQNTEEQATTQPNPVHQQSLPDDQFIVEKIVNHKKSGRGYKYQIRWKGYRSEDDTWEPSKNINHNLIKEYWEGVGARPRANAVNSLSTVVFYILFILLKCVGATQNVTKSIDLGVLYDCTVVKPVGIFEYPSLKDCDHRMDGGKDDMFTINAEILKYAPKVSKFDIYMCTLEKVTLTCDYEIFFTSAVRSRSTESLHVTAQDCMNAVRSKKLFVYSTTGDHVDLKQTRHNSWKTDYDEKYKCTAAYTESLFYYLVTIRGFPAQIIGDAASIEQHLVDSTCSSQIFPNVGFGTCRSFYEPKRIIVWEDPHHNTTEMDSFGVHEVKRSGDYVLVEDLLIGGAVQQEYDEGRLIQLDNGIVLKNPNVTEGLYEKLRWGLKYYSKKIGDNTLAPMLEAHLSSAIMNQKNLMMREWARICFIQNEMTRVHQWMISTFPTSSARWIHQESGVTVSLAGDALEVGRCMRVSSYHVFLNRTYNDTCYQDFPIITVRENELKFVRLVDRQIVSTSPRINCTNRPRQTFIKKPDGSYYQITAEGEVTLVRLRTDTAKEPHKLNLRKLRGFNEKILKRIPDHLEPYTMLQMFSYVHDAINEVKDIQANVGGGSFLLGVGRALGALIEETADGTSSIISSIGGGIKDVLNGVGDSGEKIITSLGDSASNIITSTGDAVEKSTTGIGKMFGGFFGGIGDIIKWVVITLLVALAAYMNRTALMKAIRKFLYKDKEPITDPNPTEDQPFSPTELVTLPDASELYEVPRPIPSTRPRETRVHFADGRPTTCSSRRSSRISTVRYRSGKCISDGAICEVEIFLDRKVLKCEAKIDTGSPITILKSTLLNGLNVTPYLEATSKDLRSLTDERIECPGSITVPLSIGVDTWTHRTYVASGICHDMLLGTDFLHRIGAVLDFKRKMISTGSAMTTLTYEMPHSNFNHCGPFTYNKNLKWCMVVTLSTLFTLMVLSYCLLFVATPTPFLKMSADVNVTLFEPKSPTRLTILRKTTVQTSTTPQTSTPITTTHLHNELSDTPTSIGLATHFQEKHLINENLQPCDQELTTVGLTGAPSNLNSNIEHPYLGSFCSELKIRTGKVLSNLTEIIYVVEVMMPEKINNVFPIEKLKVHWVDIRRVQERDRQPISMKCRMRVWKANERGTDNNKHS